MDKKKFLKYFLSWLLGKRHIDFLSISQHAVWRKMKVVQLQLVKRYFSSLRFNFIITFSNNKKKNVKKSHFPHIKPLFSHPEKPTERVSQTTIPVAAPKLSA